MHSTEAAVLDDGGGLKERVGLIKGKKEKRKEKEKKQEKVYEVQYREKSRRWWRYGGGWTR